MVVFIGDYASGAVVGTDGPAGPISEHRAELVLRAGDPQSGGASTTFGSFEVIQGIARGWSGCLGLQIDGPTFAETITTTNFVSS